MPKLKTHKGAKARIHVTGSGKLMRRKRMSSHLRRKKPKKVTRKVRPENGLRQGRREAPQSSDTLRRLNPGEHHTVPRVKRGVTKHARHKKVLKAAKRVPRIVQPQLQVGQRSGDARVEPCLPPPPPTQWATSAACGSSASARPAECTASPTASSCTGLKVAGIEIDRKMLADMGGARPRRFSASGRGGRRSNRRLTS